MKNLIFLSLTIFSLGFAEAQTQGSPQPYGIRVVNTDQVDYADFERIPVMYDNGQIRDWIKKEDLLAGGTAGTVTSVDLDVPTGFVVTSSAVTTSGALSFDYDDGFTSFTEAEKLKLSGVTTKATDVANGVTIAGNGYAVGGFVARSVAVTASGSYAIDFNSYSEHYTVTLGDNTSFTFLNMVGSDETATFTMSLNNPSNFAFVFPSWLKKSLTSDDPSSYDEVVINVKRGGTSPQGYYTLINAN